MEDDRLLELLHSHLVTDEGIDDALGDDASARQWLRRRGMEHGTPQIEDARRVRAALVALLRGDAPVSVLDPWVSVMQRTAKLTEAGLEWVDSTPAERRVGAAMVQLWSDLQDPDQGSRIRPCKATDCQHFLIDRSRANNRRWHQMEACGNREKARRHYARSRTTA